MPQSTSVKSFLAIPFMCILLAAVGCATVPPPFGTGDIYGRSASTAAATYDAVTPSAHAQPLTPPAWNQSRYTQAGTVRWDNTYKPSGFGRSRHGSSCFT